MYLCVYEAVVEKACCSSHLWMYSNTAQDHVCTEPETQSKHSHALPVWQIYCTREQSLKNTSQEFFFTFSPTLVSAPTPRNAHRPPGTNSSSTCLPTACLSFIWCSSLSPFFLLPLSLSCTFYWIWHVNFLQIPAIYLLKLLERWPTYKLYLNWMLDLVLLLGLLSLLSLFILLLLSSFCLIWPYCESIIFILVWTEFNYLDF